MNDSDACRHDPDYCRHGVYYGISCEDCILEGDPDAPEPEGILNIDKANEPIDWAEISRRKSAIARSWEKSGHPGSKRPTNRPELLARRKRERQARKAGRR